jgi:hypothetical protein
VGKNSSLDRAAVGIEKDRDRRNRDENQKRVETSQQNRQGTRMEIRRDYLQTSRLE